jgi:hypothetical protein
MPKDEQEILDSRRSLAKSQLLFPSTPSGDPPFAATVGWVGTRLLEETGIVGVVSQDEAQRQYIGEFVRFTWSQTSVVVYIIGARNIGRDFGLSRRAFMSLAGLWRDQITAVGVVIR